jgi:hypothetical protein
MASRVIALVEHPAPGRGAAAGERAAPAQTARTAPPDRERTARREAV